jgi:prepilin-type N-terminal cleavage/methylation domain-containing protein
MTRRGFTLIEILVTIGIIVILAAMVLIATRAITGNSKARATHIALDNCKSLLAEYDTAKNISQTSASQCWIWLDQGGGVQQIDPAAAAAATPTALNFFMLPYNTASFPNQPLDAPGYVKDDAVGLDQRNGSRAVVNTMMLMGQLAAIPANREALLKLPQEQVFIPNSQTGSIASPASGNRFLNGDNTDSSQPIACPAGCRVRLNGVVYVATANQNPATAPPGGNWRVDANSIPMLRDGWGNPIIFVPATGLGVRLLNGKKDYVDGDVTQKYIIISPEGAVTNNGTANPVVTRVGRPFWASAGPDGDFSKGDDNIYSFEQ